MVMSELQVEEFLTRLRYGIGEARAMSEAPGATLEHPAAWYEGRLAALEEVEKMVNELRLAH